MRTLLIATAFLLGCGPSTSYCPTCDPNAPKPTASPTPSPTVDPPSVTCPTLAPSVPDMSAPQPDLAQDPDMSVPEDLAPYCDMEDPQPQPQPDLASAPDMSEPCKECDWTCPKHHRHHHHSHCACESR